MSKKLNDENPETLSEAQRRLMPDLNATYGPAGACCFLNGMAEGWRLRERFDADGKPHRPDEEIHG